jgi:hypothetical protein
MRELNGAILIVAGYFGVFGLSPGVAFRTGDAFNAMLDAIPQGCEIYQERLYLAHMAAHGTVLADSELIGYIANHAGQYGKSLVDTPGELARQHRLMLPELDKLAEPIDRIDLLFRGFFAPTARGLGAQWLRETDGFEDASPILKIGREILRTMV